MLTNLGDRSAHAPVFHFSQFLYFLGFYLFMNIFSLDTWQLQKFAGSFKDPMKVVLTLCGLLVCGYLVHLYR
jgi:hypothetical protein